MGTQIIPWAVIPLLVPGRTIQTREYLQNYSLALPYKRSKQYGRGKIPE